MVTIDSSNEAALEPHVVDDVSITPGTEVDHVNGDLAVTILDDTEVVSLIEDVDPRDHDETKREVRKGTRMRKPPEWMTSGKYDINH